MISKRLVFRWHRFLSTKILLQHSIDSNTNVLFLALFYFCETLHYSWLMVRYKQNALSLFHSRILRQQPTRLIVNFNFFILNAKRQLLTDGT